MQTRLAELGNTHEHALLAAYEKQYGQWTPHNPSAGGVFRADTVDEQHREELTAQAFATHADVLYQIDIHDGELTGRADFIVKQPDDTYAVYDTKLARTASTQAVLQITAYAHALKKQGINVSRHGYLALGSGDITRHSLLDTTPVYLRLRHTYEQLIASRANKKPAQWATNRDNPHALHTCGRCPQCTRQLEPHRDVLLVSGCTTAHRTALNTHGIHTVEDLAALATHPENPDSAVTLDPQHGRININSTTLNKLVAQAQLLIDGEAHYKQHGIGLYKVYDTKAFTLLHPESPGDIFFDFEGDPLYAETGSHEWGLEYLFGWCTREHDDTGHRAFTALWAHNRKQEKQAFEQFIDYLTQRVDEHPGMHVYHYAPYETTALKRLAVRHGTREDALDALLRAGIFVDLYAVVRGTIRTSGHSLSIKKLEPFYADKLGENRQGVTTAVDSITQYAHAIALRDAGKQQESAAELALIAEYNRYDCESTYHLLNWIGDIAEANGVHWRTATHQTLIEEPNTLDDDTPRHATTTRLHEHIERLTEQWHHAIAHAEAHGLPHPAEPDARTIARMGWAAIDYNKRENKQYWWSHYARLHAPIEEWSGSEIFRPTRSEVIEDWHTPPKARTHQRLVRLHGELEPGNKLSTGTNVVTIYNNPAPPQLKTSTTGIRSWGSAHIESLDLIPGPGDYASIVIREKTGKTEEPWDDLPVGLGPSSPIATTAIDERLLEYGQEILAALEDNPDRPHFPDTARTRLLQRRGTAHHTLDPDSSTTNPWTQRILASLRADDHAVVAVQGPPGAGKTYVASHVIATLARSGWNIGVVAQSHAVVENVLHAVLKRGLTTDMVAKKPGRKLEEDETWPFTIVEARTAADYFAQAATGTVTGGTAWTYSHPDFSPTDGYDLIVIDEAGQYSMANSLAVTHRAQRILLLGDPQQLPQVSQGTHPEPVDESALAWLVEDHPTITEDRGFFLDQTWRMHPDLTEVVSELSYEGKLHSVPHTQERYVAGLRPGLHTMLVDHHGNTVRSREEARIIVDTIARLCGTQWRLDDSHQARPLEPRDFIVVAPYTAQVKLLRDDLNRAGFTETPVGTVDKFQGQEAAIALVSLAVSDVENSPRGLEFVRNRNRLNVSISRGQHSAFLVHAPALLDAVPHTIPSMEEQGAFMRLSQAGITENL